MRECFPSCTSAAPSDALPQALLRLLSGGQERVLERGRKRDVGLACHERGGSPCPQMNNNTRPINECTAE